MRKGVLVVLLLAGCAQTMTLYPRGGGAPVTGNLETASRNMTVTMDGDVYAGSFTRADSAAIGNITTVGARPGQFSTSSVLIGPSSKQYSALLVSKAGKTLRCEFVGGLGETGNGVCTAGDGRVFDLLLTP